MSTETLSPETLAAEAAAIERSRHVPNGLVLSWRQFLFWFTFFHRTWRGTVLSAILGPVMYLTAMGVGIGTLVDQGHDLPGGANYLSFIAPGVLAATAMQNGIFEGGFPVLGSLKWNGNYWAAVATPQRPQDVMLGTAMQGMARTVGLSVVFFCAMLGFGTVHSAWGVLALPVALLTGAVFLFAMMSFSVTLDSDQPLNVVFRFVMTPLFLFSGTFFPWQQLPGWMQPVAFATPLWHGVELCRELTLGTVDAGSALIHLGYLLAALAVTYWLALRNFRRRLYLDR
jgi:lipooligosaccharide transport system permease protein